MTDYRIGYEHYKKVCLEHSLQPLNFHYFILNLSQQQLEAYNNIAEEQNRGINEYANTN